MAVNRALTKIVNREGVRDIFVIDRSMLPRLEILESPVSYGCRYENPALDLCRTKDLVVCVFSEGFLEEPTDMLTYMTDDTGEIYGHDVPRGMSRDSIREGAVWVDSTFVMYPDTIPKSELRFVVRPRSLGFLSEAEGVRDTVVYNPSVAADRYLKRLFGLERARRLVSTIVAMDFV